MSVLPAQASFSELVQDCFLALSGRGLMLSALDAQLVAEWSQRQVPLEVVIRGLFRAQARLLYDARPGERPIRSLRACGRDVESEIKRHFERSAGAQLPAEEAEPKAKAPRKLLQSLRELKVRRPELEEVVDNLCETAPTLSLERRDEVILYRLLRALPRAERSAVLREARASVQEEAGTTWHARRVSRRFHRLLSTRRALQLPAFW